MLVALLLGKVTIKEIKEHVNRKRGKEDSTKKEE